MASGGMTTDEVKGIVSEGFLEEMPAAIKTEYQHVKRSNKKHDEELESVKAQCASLLQEFEKFKSQEENRFREHERLVRENFEKLENELQAVKDEVQGKADRAEVEEIKEKLISIEQKLDQLLERDNRRHRDEPTEKGWMTWANVSKYTKQGSQIFCMIRDAWDKIKSWRM